MKGAPAFPPGLSRLPSARAALLAAFAVLTMIVPFRTASAQGTLLADTRSASLADLTLEQLSNIVVTLVSRRNESLSDAAASVYVISAEDIRRSGVVSLPEALRLAPNLQVARADANQYAITARGFNSVLANKMLVMIDGRTVYSPLFSGVFWEAQDVLLDDVDRIEVVSGPGGTLWGINAVNGIIHVITRSGENTIASPKEGSVPRTESEPCVTGRSWDRRTSASTRNTAKRRTRSARTEPSFRTPRTASKRGSAPTGRR